MLMHIVDRRLNPKGKSLANRQRFLRRTRAQIQKAVRDALCILKPPFLRADVKEWEPAGRNTFLHGLFGRLAEDGPHPGLSDPLEASFRLRLADAVGLDWLERLALRRPLPVDRL